MLFAESNVLWVGLTILFSVFNFNDAAYMRCYRGSFTEHTEVPLSSPDTLITDENPCIDVTKGTMMLLNGFKNDAEKGEAIVTLITTYISLKKLNVILVNWSIESQGYPGIGPLGYPIALRNSKVVAEDLATAILRLIGLGLSKNIHLIGHSLGAHIAGYAGLKTIEKNFTIPCISGLDPARPGFQILPPYDPISKESATFVDLLHSDLGGYGLNKSSGHVDIYPNMGNFIDGTNLQPGCKPGFTPEEILIDGNRESHDRAWQYYNVSITQPELFKIGLASDYYAWVAKDGSFDDEEVTNLGPTIDKTKRGNFYFTTSSDEPWGLGDDGLVGCLPEEYHHTILPLS